MPGWLGALRRYFAVLAVGSLSWEFLHMPLYTLWKTGTWGDILFAGLHCTGGDLLVGGAALMAALAAAADPEWPARRFRRVAALCVAGGLLYTGFSEWLNVEVRKSWSYSELMPIIPIGEVELGLSPILQWLVIPALALLAAGAGRRTAQGAEPPPGAGSSCGGRGEIRPR